MPVPFADPPAGRGADYVEWLAGLHWNAKQLAVVRRAESLHALGRPREAADLVAFECEWPPGVSVRDFGMVSSLDLRRWLAAYTGRPWDGIPASMRSARDEPSHANDTLKYVYKYMSKPQQQSPIESSAAVVTTARDDVACTSVHVVACVALGCRARDPC